MLIPRYCRKIQRTGALTYPARLPPFLIPLKTSYEIQFRKIQKLSRVPEVPQ